MELAIKNKTSERIVVGILLNNPEWIVDNIGLEANYFFDKTHKWIYFLIDKLIQENVPTIDSMAIIARAEKFKDAMNVLESSGGYEYIENIKYICEDYTRDDLGTHSKIVIECAYKREQISQKEDFIEEVKNNKQWGISDINNWLQEKQFSLQTKYSVGSDVGLLKEIFDEKWNNMEKNRTESGIVGLPSKIPIVNNYFTYRNKELVIIGARAKVFGSLYRNIQAIIGRENWEAKGIVPMLIRVEGYI